MQIIQLVRHAAGESADRVEVLNALEMLFERSLCGEVLDGSFDHLVAAGNLWHELRDEVYGNQRSVFALPFQIAFEARGRCDGIDNDRSVRRPCVERFGEAQTREFFTRLVTQHAHQRRVRYEEAVAV